MFRGRSQVFRHGFAGSLGPPLRDQFPVGDREKQRSKAALLLVRRRERKDREQCFLTELFGPPVVGKSSTEVGIQRRAVSRDEPIERSPIASREGGHQELVGGESHHPSVTVIA